MGGVKEEEEKGIHAVGITACLAGLTHTQEAGLWPVIICPHVQELVFSALL